MEEAVIFFKQVHLPIHATPNTKMILLLITLAATTATMANSHYLPPVLPKEHTYQFIEQYYAINKANGEIVASINTTGTQYWSYFYQSQRGIISAGPSIDKGHHISALNTMTITNYNDVSNNGSLVIDLIQQSCATSKNEGV